MKITSNNKNKRKNPQKLPEVTIKAAPSGAEDREVKWHPQEPTSSREAFTKEELKWSVVHFMRG